MLGRAKKTDGPTLRGLMDATRSRHGVRFRSDVVDGAMFMFEEACASAFDLRTNGTTVVVKDLTEACRIAKLAVEAGKTTVRIVNALADAGPGHTMGHLYRNEGDAAVDPAALVGVIAPADDPTPYVVMAREFPDEIPPSPVPGRTLDAFSATTASRSSGVQPAALQEAWAWEAFRIGRFRKDVLDGTPCGLSSAGIGSDGEVHFTQRPSFGGFGPLALFDPGSVTIYLLPDFRKTMQHVSDLYRSVVTVTLSGKGFPDGSRDAFHPLLLRDPPPEVVRTFMGALPRLGGVPFSGYLEGGVTWTTGGSDDGAAEVDVSLGHGLALDPLDVWTEKALGHSPSKGGMVARVRNGRKVPLVVPKEWPV